MREIRNSFGEYFKERMFNMLVSNLLLKITIQAKRHVCVIRCVFSQYTGIPLGLPITHHIPHAKLHNNMCVNNRFEFFFDVEINLSYFRILQILS